VPSVGCVNIRNYSLPDCGFNPSQTPDCTNATCDDQNACTIDTCTVVGNTATCGYEVAPCDTTDQVCRACFKLGWG
jgi:hypothetical protein